MDYRMLTNNLEVAHIVVVVVDLTVKCNFKFNVMTTMTRWTILYIFDCHSNKCRRFREGNPGMCGMAPEYSCIVPLRLLTLRRRDPELWSRVQRLMDHDEERRGETKYWKMFQVRNHYCLGIFFNHTIKVIS